MNEFKKKKSWITKATQMHKKTEVGKLLKYFTCFLLLIMLWLYSITSASMSKVPGPAILASSKHLLETCALTQPPIDSDAE